MQVDMNPRWTSSQSVHPHQYTPPSCGGTAPIPNKGQDLEIPRCLAQQSARNDGRVRHVVAGDDASYEGTECAGTEWSGQANLASLNINKRKALTAPAPLAITAGTEDPAGDASKVQDEPGAEAAQEQEEPGTEAAPKGTAGAAPGLTLPVVSPVLEALQARDNAKAEVKQQSKPKAKPKAKGKAKCKAKAKAKVMAKAKANLQAKAKAKSSAVFFEETS